METSRSQKMNCNRLEIAAQRQDQHRRHSSAHDPRRTAHHVFPLLGPWPRQRSWPGNQRRDFWLVDCKESDRRCTIEARALVEQDSLQCALLCCIGIGDSRCTERSATQIKANDPIAGCRRTDRPFRVLILPAKDCLFVRSATTPSKCSICARASESFHHRSRRTARSCICPGIQSYVCCQ